MTLVDTIRERGPITVAAFMDLALYDPDVGYYARANRRTGRAGDFFTSVDVGPLFGDLIEVQIAEMADLLGTGPIDLIEAGAADGRLSADILEAMRRRHPALYARTRLGLVEASPAARAAHATVLAAHVDRVASSGAELPSSFEGVLLANELFDAMPVHQVVMREDGLREVYVDVEHATDRLILREGRPSTPALAAYLAQAGAHLEAGWRAEINLVALDWIRRAATRLRRGFAILIDYGHEAADLYSSSHAGGTLTTYTRHRSSGAEADPARPAWLEHAGDQDLTAHVDFTSLRAAAKGAGFDVLGFLDQTYFVMGLMDARQFDDPRASVDQMKDRLALKTLLLPGGLGSTMKVLLLGKGMGTPALRGCRDRGRVS